jgi:hypothetical protein
MRERLLREGSNAGPSTAAIRDAHRLRSGRQSLWVGADICARTGCLSPTLSLERREREGWGTGKAAEVEKCRSIDCGRSLRDGLRSG